MPSPRWLHIVRVDVDPCVEKAFNIWYDEEHIPALLTCPGWLAAKRYIALDGGPRYAAVYEIEGEWAYNTPQFEKVKGFAHFEQHVYNFVRLVLEPLRQ